jgi:hypothetical protein
MYHLGEMYLDGLGTQPNCQIAAAVRLIQPTLTIVFQKCRGKGRLARSFGGGCDGFLL